MSIRNHIAPVIACLAAGIGGVVAGSVVVGASVSSTSEVQILGEPERIIDTRNGDELPAVIPVGVAQRQTWTTVAIVNIAVLGANRSGFVTLWDCVGEPPDVSHMNYDRGAVTSSLAFAPLGPSGELCVYNYGDQSVDFVVDVMGWSAPSVSYGV